MTGFLRSAPLALLAVFTAVALTGYATFGVHPELLMRVPGALDVYSGAFTFFARIHVMLAFGVAAIELTRIARGRWLPALGVVYAISLASELLGTTVGLPFGPYAYTDGLGAKWFSHVPLLIPLSWFTMALPSFAIARLLLRQRTSHVRAGRATILVGSIILLAWDLALDPAMSFATKYWIWGRSGPYYGMPWLNLAGWFVTGVALMAALSALGAKQWTDRLSPRWTRAFYAVNLALPLGMCAAKGLWLAVAATLAALGIIVLATADATRRHPVAGSQAVWQ